MRDADRAEMHLREDCPRVASVLALADANRSTRLSMYGGGATLRGIDEALDYLRQANSAFGQSPRLKPLQQLVARALAELETAVFAFLTGFHAVLFDSMRSAMEIEFLLRDFLLWPSHLDEWLSLEAKERRKKFSPVKLRERYQRWLGCVSADSQESSDYALHSEFLHVSPSDNPSGAPGATTDSHPAHLRICLAEIISHTGRIITLVHRHWRELPLDVQLTRETAPELPLFEDAWSRAELGVAMWWPQKHDGGR